MISTINLTNTRRRYSMDFCTFFIRHQTKINHPFEYIFTLFCTLGNIRDGHRMWLGENPSYDVNFSYVTVQQCLNCAHWGGSKRFSIERTFNLPIVCWTILEITRTWLFILVEVLHHIFRSNDQSTEILTLLRRRLFAWKN